MDQGLWSPVSISIGGPPITHLYFTDDLFIFAEASMNLVEVIKNCLEVFGNSSRQKRSKEKKKNLLFLQCSIHHARATKM